MKLRIVNEHFQREVAPASARELFRRSVNLVEVETFTYCNRKCFFCPNAVIPQRQDKGDGNQIMSDALYDDIIGGLRSIDYAGEITYSRYNEPLAMRDLILRRVAEARKALPRARLMTHTNGDYLTRDYLDALRDAGLNKLCVQTYLGDNVRYDDAKMRARQNQQVERLSLTARPILDEPGVRLWSAADYPGMVVTFDARNFDEIGVDRGGLVQLRCEHRRTSPCFVPFTSLYIDVDGSIVPCCNIRSDVDAHKQYVVTKLVPGQVSIFDAYIALADWRASLLQYGPKAAPCDTCAYEALAYEAPFAGLLRRIAIASGL